MANTTASSSFSTSIVVKVNGIDDHHRQHQNKDSKISRNDAPIVVSTIADVCVEETSSKFNVAPALQENVVQIHHHSSVSKVDGDKRGGSDNGDGGSGSGTSIVVAKRRNRYTNGTLIRSHSFDNGKYDSVHGRMLSKSKTLGCSNMMPSTSISRVGSKKKRIKTLSANGNLLHHHNCQQHCSVDRLDETTRTDTKRRRLFQTSTIDQSPLWTTLTHARTMSDFIFDS